MILNSKQQLNTSNKQYATNRNLIGNPVFIKEEISCSADFCARQLYEIWRWSEHTDRNVELSTTKYFKNQHYSKEIYTWRYRKPYPIILLPGIVSNPTYVITIFVFIQLWEIPQRSDADCQRLSWHGEGRITALWYVCLYVLRSRQTTSHGKNGIWKQKVHLNVWGCCPPIRLRTSGVASLISDRVLKQIKCLNSFFLPLHQFVLSTVYFPKSCEQNPQANHSCGIRAHKLCIARFELPL